jgi:quercetin dioxygenase-like cupin family protein
METIENPVIGERVTFLTTARGSNGDKSVLEVLLSPKGGNPLHYHKLFSETFKVLEGQLNVQVGKEIKILNEGETAFAPTNSVHRFFNTSGKPVRFICELNPASEGFENVLRIAFGLSRDGQAASNGLPKSIWHMAVMMDMGEGYFVGVFSVFEKVFRFLARTSKGRRIAAELTAKYCSDYSKVAVS